MDSGLIRGIIKSRILNDPAMVKLIDCETLINIEGDVYKLSEDDCREFIKQVLKRHSNSDLMHWPKLLHWARERGKLICHVQSYNF